MCCPRWPFYAPRHAVRVHIANQVVSLASAREREVIYSRRVAEDAFDRISMRFPGVSNGCERADMAERSVGAGDHGCVHEAVNVSLYGMFLIWARAACSFSME